jgi:2-succinyl-6-hydroxy-2,4-cyclohexadiene-1-carboxylate synthase
MLATTHLSSSSGPRYVLAHGFTQNSRCWGSFGHLLGETGTVVAVDAPGHGDSRHDEADLVQAGRLLGEAGLPGVYVGYSMGGRMALHTALDPVVAPHVEALVLIGATAGLESEGERADRRRADEALAEDLLRDGLEAFLDRWLSLPLFAGIAREDQHRAERLANRPEGLAASLRNCGTGTQQPLWSRLGDIAVPVLLLSGDNDAKFTALAARMASFIPAATAMTIADAGHACHTEQPARTVDAILAWLATLRNYGW